MSGLTGHDTADLSPWQHAYSGKVRDLYVPPGATLENAERILVVASDRVSAFDHVLEPGIPGKGALLTQLSLWWFDQLGMPNHLRMKEAGSTTGSDSASSGLSIPSSVADRSMLVANLKMFPIECVVRGYLTGSGWAEYQESGGVCGVPLPAGLHEADKLPEPIFTPAYKAPFGEHDENITFEHMVELVGAEDAAALRELSLEIFAKAAAIAEAKGILLADTKFEFGRDESGQISLADEVLTSDSSRYWDAAAYASASTPQEKMISFDKQIVRNWLSANWDKHGTPPVLPAEIVAQTAARYRELIDRLIG